ncbi:MAG: hypothetical protein HUU60_10075 [Armatimonadetes bacterium]|nr:hypothetical protein [Armatimonadota bacterium]
MKILRGLFQVVLVASIVVGIGTYPILANYTARAKLIQRVEHDPATARLMGEPGAPIGSAHLMIIDDPKAFLPEFKEEGSPHYVNEAYLREHDIYPLQLRTVEEIAALLRYGALGGILVSIVGLTLLNRRSRRVNNADKKVAA